MHDKLSHIYGTGEVRHTMLFYLRFSNVFVCHFRVAHLDLRRRNGSGHGGLSGTTL